jgi:Holliday junction resolvase-like predicted endonuclease
MASHIEVWQIKQDGKREMINSSPAENNSTEPKYLETWLSNNPTVLSKDIRLIGRQLVTKTGEADLLAIDSTGNIVVIELQRDTIPPTVFGRAMDHALDIAKWDIVKLNEVCFNYHNQNLKEYFCRQFPDSNIEDITFNAVQRIFIISFKFEEELQRMFQWLCKTNKQHNVEVYIIRVCL